MDMNESPLLNTLNAAPHRTTLRRTSINAAILFHTHTSKAYRIIYFERCFAMLVVPVPVLVRAVMSFQRAVRVRKKAKR